MPGVPSPSPKGNGMTEIMPFPETIIVLFYWAAPWGAAFLCRLYCVQQHSKKLKQCAQYHEDMKYGVHPFPAFAQSVED